MDIHPLDRLIDPATGEVFLRLCPFHLDRLYGPWQSDEDKGHYDTGQGLPFPLLPGSESFDIVLKGGMTPEEVGPPGLIATNSSLGSTSWWRWHGYMSTPFGMSPYATPFFRHGRLCELQLIRQGVSEQMNFSAMRECFIDELGSPEFDGVNPLSLLGKIFLKPPEHARRQVRWTFPWGKVHVGFEQRDWTALTLIVWKI